MSTASRRGRPPNVNPLLGGPLTGVQRRDHRPRKSPNGLVPSRGLDATIRKTLSAIWGCTSPPDAPAP